VLGREGAAPPIECYTRDIGAGGLFAATDERLDPGERVEVELSTPATWDPLRLGARVCWVLEGSGGAPAGVGLQFVDIGGAEALALARFVEALDYEG